jgi:uncharacterized coiled-coil DUF342 family protein
MTVPSASHETAARTPGEGKVETAFTTPIAARLADWTARAEPLLHEGLPMPVDSVKGLVQQLLERGETVRAEQALLGAERLLDRATRDWALLRELLRRLDELRDLAAKAGLDLTELDQRIGDPRKILRESRLSEALLERSMAVASKSLAVINDLFPKYLVSEAQGLAHRIREARARGDEVGPSALALEQFLVTMRSGQLRGSAEAFLELRRTVTRLPKPPMAAQVRLSEEEEILREARNLARRVNRLKGRARNAATAAKLVSEVKAALSDDRRHVSPQEEIEELWNEVDRLARERLEARSAAEAEKELGEVEGELDTTDIPPEILEAANAPLDEPAPPPRRARKPKS